MSDGARPMGAKLAPYPLQRAITRLQNERFDLLVIGGGVYGAWIACDAAQRGLAVALVEARDWAAGTSSASSKLVHGGLRYLEHLQLGLVRESLHERRVLSRLAPHRVRPIRFVVPVWKSAAAGRMKLAAGLNLYDTLAGFHQPVERHGYARRATLLRQMPWLQPTGLVGGFDYGDCQHDDGRFTLDVVAAAQSAGAACANHLAAAELLRDAGRVVGAVVHDDQTGARFELRASAVVVAAGPWAGTFAGSAAPDIERVRGAHLILPAIPGCDRALVLAAPQDGRAFFVVPWYGRSLVGTTESFVSADHYAQPVAPSAQTRASLAEQRYLLEAVAAHLPGLGWTDSDVIASYAGVRSLRRAATSDLSAISREFELLTPSPGLWLPLGGKLTTARREARGVVDTLLQSLGFAPRPCRTGHTPLPGAPTAAFAEWHAAEMHELGRRAPVLDPRVLASLLNRYGTRARHIIERLQEDPRLAVRLHPELPFIAAEIRVAQDEEMALAAEDITRRRIPLAILARAGEWEATAQAWIDPR